MVASGRGSQRGAAEELLAKRTAGSPGGRRRVRDRVGRVKPGDRPWTQPPWTDPDPLIVPTTPHLTFPFSHWLLAMALLGTLSGLNAIAAGGNMTTSEAEGWQSIAVAAGMALVAVGLPRVFKGELVVADDGIARRFRSRPWRWVPAEAGQRVLIQGGKSWHIYVLSPWGKEVRCGRSAGA